MRRGVIDRQTTETQIALSLTLEGKGTYDVHTGIRFLDHMLELFARHGGFDLKVHAKGDLDVDQHHTVEDLGIALGEAVAKALGDRKGINRAGYFVMPMDETLAVAAIDLGGRPHTVTDLKVRVRLVGGLPRVQGGDMDLELIQGGRGALADLADRPDLGRLDGKFLPIERGRGESGRLRRGDLQLRLDRDEGSGARQPEGHEQGQGGDDEVAAREAGHACFLDPRRRE